MLEKNTKEKYENNTEILLENNLENRIPEIEITEESQNKFLQSNLGKVINAGLDIGLRVVLPDFVENQVIEVKDTLLQEGLKEGINAAVENSIELGKSILGMVTGTFETISQAQIAVKKGGLIDNVSEVINSVIKAATKSEVISKDMSKALKNGKDAIVESITKNVEDTFTNQIRSLEKVEKHSEQWKKAYENQEFEKMEKEYKNMQKNLKNIMPLEEIIKEARKIENLHLLIKNKNGEFELSDLEKELAVKLT